MTKLLDLPLTEVIMQLTVVDQTVITVERGMRYLMFMQAIVDAGKDFTSEQFEAIVTEMGGTSFSELSFDVRTIYYRLTALAYRLIK